MRSNITRGARLRGPRFSVLRRTSVRRLRPTRSTTDIKNLALPTPVRPAPSGRTIRAARRVGRCERGSSWPPVPWSLSAIAGRDWPLAMAESKRECDCLLLRKHVNRRVPSRNRVGAPQPPIGQPPDASRTSVPAEWCPDNGRPTQRLCRPRICPAADIGLAAGIHVGAKSRIATRLPYRCGASASSTYSWKQCTLGGVILSRGRRRTEVRRSTLKRAPRGPA
jgi:hypothetical protein